MPSIILLVDRRSASASERTALALRDYQRAVLLGERTFGKGIGQRAVLEAGNSEPIKGLVFLTNYYFFSPLGESNQLDGITPHIVIDDAVNEYQQKASKRFVRMKDRLERFGDSVIAKPEDIPPDQTNFTKPENPAISDRVLKALVDRKLPLDPICTRTPDMDTFREEDDCLLTMGVAYMRRLIELQTAEGAVASR